MDADCVDPEKVELYGRRIRAERPALDGIDLGAQKISPNKIVPSVLHTNFQHNGTQVMNLFFESSIRNCKLNFSSAAKQSDVQNVNGKNCIW